MKLLLERLRNGLFKENPIFVQVLAMCPTLAVSTSVVNALGMGISSTIVLICSNAIISAIRKFIPSKIRIPAYIVIIAGFVSAVDMFLNAYIPSLYASLGIFIPLIVVNCIILGRAEAYASKNTVIA
ncbi:MAG: electron transport complex subunit RsxE, partial [Clostridium sp.]|nr:electron transport complex subunit RsxE [Clostridium sp.]